MYLVMNQMNMLYDNEKLNMSNSDQQRYQENLAVGAEPFSQYSNTLNITVSNTCTLAVKIIRVWVNTTYTNTSVLVPPMSIVSMNSTRLVLRAGSSFKVMVATERGNLFASETGILNYGANGWDNETVPDINKNGVFSLNWFYFKYTSYQKQTPTDGMSIPKSSTYVAVYLQVTNSWNYPITVTSSSFAEWNVPYIDDDMCIVDHVTYPAKTITAYTNPITVQPGQTATLCFAASTKGGTSWLWGSGIPSDFTTSNPNNIGSIILTLYYTLLGKTYGQSLSAQGFIFT